MARGSASLALLFSLLMTACQPAAQPRAAAPEASSAALPSSSSAPAAAPSPPQRFDAIVIDGLHLGEPMATALARVPYQNPCDVDPIDHRTATLYFWAAGSCRKVAPFPSQTTVTIVTSRPSDTAPPEQQPIVLVVFTGGHYFDDKTTLPVRIGDKESALRSSLGPPTSEVKVTSIAARGADGPMPNVALLSWEGRVHVLLRDGIAVAIGVGSLEDGEERSGVIASTYRHHLRYTRAKDEP